MMPPILTSVLLLIAILAAPIVAQDKSAPAPKKASPPAVVKKAPAKKASKAVKKTPAKKPRKVAKKRPKKKSGYTPRTKLQMDYYKGRRRDDPTLTHMERALRHTAYLAASRVERKEALLKRARAKKLRRKKPRKKNAPAYRP